LEAGELLPRVVERPPRLHLRKKGGAGRFVGRRVLVLGRVTLLISLYEISSEHSVQELRIVLYEVRPSLCMV
jgi:hypothetical protein